MNKLAENVETIMVSFKVMKRRYHRTGKQWHMQSFHVSFSVAGSSFLFVPSTDQPGSLS